ncbi:MAG: 4-hydroxyphenylpyruvate dioxygenase [Bradymonadia bacterium]|jgi:4-hydroxyphenylpyruvate dioxygenase
MAKSEALGIKKLETIHFYVNDIERHERFWVDWLDFARVGETTDAHTEEFGERSVLVQAGEAQYLLTESTAADSSVGRFLERHPDGVGEIVFEVENVDATFDVLNKRGAAIVHDIKRVEGEGGSMGWFSITTAFGDVIFTFCQRDGYVPVRPGMAMTPLPENSNRFDFGLVDHVTSNFLTLKPLVLWCKEVLGLEEYWGIEFHSSDFTETESMGSGLKSIVMWDPHSGIKFANNEPLRPAFKNSQIFLFCEDNKGPGIQHTALTIGDIVATVNDMREKGMVFMPTPGPYYDALVERMDEAGIVLDETMDDLAAGGILVDGEGPGKYMLQIFASDFATIFGDKSGGPFFLEIIQRKGDRGFGGGNFKALFQSIERAQLASRLQ